MMIDSLKKLVKAAASLFYFFANILFGDNQYFVKAFWTGELYRRSAQGSLCFALSIAILALQLLDYSIDQLPTIIGLAMLALLIQVHIPHNLNEIDVALLVTIFTFTSNFVAHHPNASFVLPLLLTRSSHFSDGIVDGIGVF